MDPALLEILVCPDCKAPVRLVKNGTGLRCDKCRRVYPIKYDIPVMLLDEATIEVIAGVNLPMLIKLAEVRDRMKLPEAALAAQDAGRRYIRVASVELAGGAA